MEKARNGGGLFVLEEYLLTDGVFLLPSFVVFIGVLQ
jgi:hypothetical protein